MDGSAIFVLHTFTHTRYCYNWTFHCFPSLTPKYIVIICSICLTVAISQLWPSSMHNHWYHWYTKSKKKAYQNTVIQHKKGGGLHQMSLHKSMTQFTTQIRTARELKQKSLPKTRLAWQHLQMAEWIWRAFSEAYLRCWFNLSADFIGLRPKSSLLTVGWVMGRDKSADSVSKCLKKHKIC